MNPFSVFSHHRFLGGLLLSILGVLLVFLGTDIFRQHSDKVQPPNSVSQKPEEKAESGETLGALPPPEDALARGFRSGGLGLSRGAWEFLHGRPDRIVDEIFLYQGMTYKVTYQHDIIWQLEKMWEQSGIGLAQVRARIRRYIPLDSHYVRTDTVSDDIIVDVYSSSMLVRRLAQAFQRGSSTAGRQEEEPESTCIAVHYLVKQFMMATLFQIGNPTQVSRLALPRESKVLVNESKKPHARRGTKGKKLKKESHRRH